MLHITALYTAILILFMLFLAYKTSARRQEAKINFGTGDDKVMECRSRAFGNFIEFVPMMILLMGMLELQSVETWIVHLLGISIIVARVLHALGITDTLKTPNGRFWGATISYAILLLGGCFLLYTTVSQMI